MNAPKPDWGVIEYQHHIVCWFLVDEAGPIFEARILGSEQLLELTPELQAAIEADRRRVK